MNVALVWAPVSALGLFVGFCLVCNELAGCEGIEDLAKSPGRGLMGEVEQRTVSQLTPGARAGRPCHWYRAYHQSREDRAGQGAPVGLLVVGCAGEVGLG